MPAPAGIEPATVWSPVGHASNWATESGYISESVIIPPQTVFGGWGVWGGGVGGEGGSILFSRCPSVRYILVSASYLANWFMNFLSYFAKKRWYWSAIAVTQNRAKGLIPLEFLCNSWKSICVSASYLAK